MSKNFEEEGIETNRLFYAAFYHTVKFLGRVLLGMKVEGVENVPSEGPALIASKHSHWLDIFLLPTAVPDRHVSQLGRDTALRTPILGWCFVKWGLIPLPRETFGSEGKEAWREIDRRLAADRLVSAFPEGTRIPGEIGKLKPGVARFVRRANVKTIPARLSVERRPSPRHF